MWVALPFVALLPIAAAFALASGAPSREKLLAAVERPAAPPASQVRVAVARTGSYRIVLRTGPNRASVTNAISLRVTEAGHPVNGARVTVGFSMPAMDMTHAYTSRPQAGGAGSYTATVPVLGMSGIWHLRVRVVRPGTRAITVNFNDRLGT
jgi:hypothetical protein